MRLKLILSILFIFITGITIAQNTSVTVSGTVKDSTTKVNLPFVNVQLKNAADASFVTGTVSNDAGLFTLTNVKPGNYSIELSYVGYIAKKQSLFIGSSTQFLNIPAIEIQENKQLLGEVVVTAQAEDVSSKMDKKSFSVDDNISQKGGSVLQAMQNLPGVTVQDGKVNLRGSDKIVVLIDGKQSALTGFGSQTGLDNLPASAIDRIEIINNPSAKYDANGNAGIINIIYKKEKQEGFNGKLGLASGLGALWEKRANYPTIRPQYQATPKVNPSLSLNYRKNKVNLFFNGDYLYTETLNKNEFVERTYDNGDIVFQQLKRNRNTTFITTKAGLDYNLDDNNLFTVSGLFGTEKIIDNGDQPFFEDNLNNRYRLWQFLEDELKTTVVGSVIYQHKFKEPGKVLNAGFNYTFHREDEQYFFDNILPTTTGRDAFKLLSDESVYDFNLDYIQPLKYGRFETGLKFRRRNIPTNMQFFPGVNSPIDADAGGAATYSETIPAVYGTYIFETQKYEAEVGLRVEYFNLDYFVNPDHPTYKSDGNSYTQPFPNLRLAYKINDANKISVFYNRRVDRPNEVDIRIFPKYDDAEIIKVGNPALRPQFTNSLELGFKTSWTKGYFYSAAYHRFANGTITRIGSTVGGSNIIYNIFQNAGKSYNSGLEVVFSQKPSFWYDLNVNVNVYRNQINAFTVQNLYPTPNTFSAGQDDIISGNVKLNQSFKMKNNFDTQLTATYLAADIIPQGKIGARFSLDLGLKKGLKNGKDEFFLNATDILNTMVINREIFGSDFKYTSKDYYETQVIRLGYSRKF
ncbi:outer membrane beta-barrel family protein [Pedobacter cryophilus]|uniref:TonB-dependent receptor n=1 Tax=Pedobacter cryophilus TaxID=2571271 RepID=A0A4U1BYE2_9SPHI|nr:outer membrane beta-barrel family protein [Pedobacter cryophilus]TKB97589.1 TonB-dependent receptor [Pedobacter cryophilus]